MALSVNVTVSMPPEMVREIDAAADERSMGRSEYVRWVLRTHDECPVGKDGH